VSQNRVKIDNRQYGANRTIRVNIDAPNNSHHIAYCQSNRLFILMERVEMEIGFGMATGMFKTKMDIDRHGPRLMPNNCQSLEMPYFSLPTTFKEKGFYQ
jgi:hypothetical protein